MLQKLQLSFKQFSLVYFAQTLRKNELELQLIIEGETIEEEKV